MSIRNGSRCAAAIAIGCLLSIVVSTAPALGNPAATGEEATAGTIAWLGCWRLAEAGEDDVPASADASQLFCLEPGDGPSSLRLRAIVDDQVVAEEMLVADGGRRPVNEDGCSGWKRSLLSADQRRLYLQSETTCEGGNPSSFSGASLIVSGGHWVDIHVARVDGERELVVRHYRIVDPDTARLPGAIPTAGRAARVAAAAPLEAEDVIEALEYLDPAVVEAMLVESGSSFPLDSHLLLRFADAGVPDQIIDLMLALSYPEYFAVDDDTIDTQSVVYNYYWTPWFHGYGYGYGYIHPPHVPDSRPRQRGWAISGRGYTRVRPSNLPSSGIGLPGVGAGGGVSSGSSGGSGSSASKSGYEKDSSTSTRRAVPR